MTTYREIIKLLENIEHELTTLNGLYATDGFGSYSHAMSEGCDSDGAFDIFVNDCFKIKTGKYSKKINVIKNYINELHKTISNMEYEEEQKIENENRGLLKWLNIFYL